MALEASDGTLLAVRDAGKSSAAAAHGYEIRTVQALLGHADIRTTQIDTHALNRVPRAWRSPLAGIGLASLPLP